jgi:hypothetical protein
VPRALGVDVSLGRGLDAALLNGPKVVRTWSRIGPDGLAALLREHAPDAVGIDAPPRPGLSLLGNPEEAARLPVPPRPGTHLHRRVAEYELSRRGIGSHQTPADETRLFTWMTAGFEAFAAAEAAGYPPFLGEGSPVCMASGERWAFEVFPYASYVAMAGCLSPGRRHRLTWRRSVLEREGIEGLGDDAPIDVLDAACAALTAGRFVEGRGSWVGDAREGAIVLPVAVLQERYRRCTPPDGPIRPADAAAPRLCACGCGAPVRRRFLPGHDAILKSRLLREVRVGEAAAAELRRLGWARRRTTEDERG